MDEFQSIMSRLYLLSALAFAFCAGFFLAGLGNQMSALALTMHGSIYLSYFGPAALKQTGMTLDDPGTGEIIPLSSNDYSGSRGISVQQNVTQHNICSSNTAYCYNEVDNDFNVNPP